MLTLIPAILVFGRSYYKLALFHDRNALGYAILGIVIFLALQFLFGIFILILLLMANAPDVVSSFVVSLFAIGFGMLGTYGIQKILEKKWKRKPRKDEFAELLNRWKN